MNIQTEVVQKLSRYGIDCGKQSQRSLQQKIIQMYELLEQKTTQNLLLRKQNDDVKLQINTINDLFADVLDSSQEFYLKQSSKMPKIIQQSENQHKTKEQNKHFETQSSFRKAKCQQKLTSPQQKNKREAFSKKYFDESHYSQQSSIQTESKTPRYLTKPYQNSKFSESEYDKEKTSRMIGQKSINQDQKGLNEKIELLMKQNEIILKRMNQIEVNFISKSQEQNHNFHHRKNMTDDRSTNFSAKIPSINNMNKQKSIQDSHNRAHYSTSNLRSRYPNAQ